MNPTDSTAATQREQARKPGRRRWRWAKRIAVMLVALLVAAVAGHGIWGWRSASQLEEQLQAYRVAGEPVDPDDFIPPPLRDSENAAVVLAAAALSIDTESEAWQQFERKWVGAKSPLSTAEVEAYTRALEAYAPALEAPREAARRPQIRWDVSLGSPALLNVNFDFLTEQRTLANLLSADAALAIQAGRSDVAVRRADELLYLSECVDRQPMLIPHLVALGLSSLACEVAIEASRDLRVGDEGLAAAAAPLQLGPPTPRAARRADVVGLINRLLREEHLVRSRQEMMLGERMFLIDAAKAVADGRLALVGTPGSTTGGEEDGAAAVGYLLKPVALGDALLMARYATAVRAALAAPDLPTFRASLAQSHPPLDEAISPPALHLVANIILPNFSRVSEQDYKSLGNRRVAATALACRLYAIDHDGQLPDGLEQLVPDYLPHVPTDPQTAGKPLGYVPDPRRPVLYTVGPNGRDDGGHEPPPTATKRVWDETSDDVRHLKRQPRVESSLDSEGWEEDLSYGPFLAEE